MSVKSNQSLKLLSLLEKRGQTVSVAESCTGGWLSSCLVHHSGSSRVYKGGVVTYTLEAKSLLLGIPESAFCKGAVADSVARLMAQACRQKLGADWGLSVTGLAGPLVPEGETEVLGTTFIAVASREESFVKKHTYKKERTENREVATLDAIEFLYEILKKTK